MVVLGQVAPGDTAGSDDVRVLTEVLGPTVTRVLMARKASTARTVSCREADEALTE